MPGQVKITLKHIAERAEVSSVAAGSVLLGSGRGNVRVAEATAERIRRIAAELNYRPNQIARQLKGKKSHVIGAIADSFLPEVHYNLLARIERMAAKMGYRFMVGQSHGEVASIRDYAEDFTSRGVDGIVCLSHDYPEVGKEVAEIFGRIKNVVFIDRPFLEKEDVNYVTKDYAFGMSTVIEHLVSHGRRRIAFLQFAGWSVMESRYKGYCLGLKKTGLDFDPNLVCDIGSGGDFTWVTTQGLQPIIMNLLNRHKVDAILACNDYVGATTLKTLHILGCKVPDDVAVIGYDNLRLCEILNPSLTTLDPRNDLLAEKAVNMLMRLVQGEKLNLDDRQVVVKPRLVIRDSA